MTHCYAPSVGGLLSITAECRSSRVRLLEFETQVSDLKSYIFISHNLCIWTSSVTWLVKGKTIGNLYLRGYFSLHLILHRKTAFLFLVLLYNLLENSQNPNSACSKLPLMPSLRVRYTGAHPFTSRARRRGPFNVVKTDGTSQPQVHIR